MSLKINKRELKRLIAALDSNQHGPKNRKFYGRLLLDFGWPFDRQWLFWLDDDFRDRTGKSFINLFNVGDYTFAEIATILELVYIYKILD